MHPAKKIRVEEIVVCEKENYRDELTRFGSRFPRPIHGDFDRLRIGGDLEGYRADLYRQRKRLSCN